MRRTSLRRKVWQAHSWMGLIAGLGLVVIGATGSLLVFHDELAALFSPEKTVVVPTPASRLAYDDLLRRAESQLSDFELTGWHPRKDRSDRADELYMIRHGTNVWLTSTLDPYTGQLLATPVPLDKTLHGQILDLHQSFFAGDLGMAVTGILAVLLCALGLSGVWLYRHFWRHFLTLRWHTSARILFSDVHKAVGISSVAFNLILGFTGAYWNITHTAEHLKGAEVEQPVILNRLYPSTLSVDAIVRDSEVRLPGFRAAFISLPSVPTAPAITIWGAVEPRPLLRNRFGTTLSYDAATGVHRATNDLRQASAWTRVVDTFQPLHFGNFGGLIVRIVWCAAGLTPGALAITGFVLWRSRHRRAPRREPVQIVSLSATP